MVIKSFRGEFRFLSNFWPAVITTAKGTKCATVEHAYQAAKTVNPLEQAAVLSCDTPGKAKRMGKQIQLRKDWNEVRYRVMEKLVTMKFTQNPDLGKKLANTFPHLLVEGNTWHDTYWGKCYCSKHNGEGKNLLGMLLMKVREEIRNP